MRLPSSVTAFFVLVGFSCACNTSSVPVGFCTAAVPTAVTLTIVDSVTGAGIADSTSGSAVSGSYQDSLHHLIGFDSLAWAGNQLGTYSVTVHRSKYVDWNRPNIVVSQVGACGNVIPVALTVRMVRSP